MIDGSELIMKICVPPHLFNCTASSVVRTTATATSWKLPMRHVGDVVFDVFRRKSITVNHADDSSLIDERGGKRGRVFV